MAKKEGTLDRVKTFYQKHSILCHLAMVCCVAAFLLFFSLFFIDVWTNHGRTVVVPEVRKKTFEEATELLKKSHLKYEISDSVYDLNSEPGIVKEIWPHPGTHVKPGRVIFLTINSFQPQMITIGMPLTGVSSRQAMSYLESLNIKNVRIVYVPSNFADLVEGAKYNGETIKPGMKIPINANIVLEVGTKTNKPSEPDPADVVIPNIVDDFEPEPVVEEKPAAETQASTKHQEPLTEPVHEEETDDGTNPDIFN